MDPDGVSGEAALIGEKWLNVSGLSIVGCLVCFNGTETNGRGQTFQVKQIPQNPSTSNCIWVHLACFGS